MIGGERWRLEVGMERAREEKFEKVAIAIREGLDWSGFLILSLLSFCCLN